MTSPAELTLQIAQEIDRAAFEAWRDTIRWRRSPKDAERRRRLAMAKAERIREVVEKAFLGRYSVSTSAADGFPPSHHETVATLTIPAETIGIDGRLPESLRDELSNQLKTQLMDITKEKA